MVVPSPLRPSTSLLLFLYVLTTAGCAWAFHRLQIGSVVECVLIASVCGAALAGTWTGADGCRRWLLWRERLEWTPIRRRGWVARFFGWRLAGMWAVWFLMTAVFLGWGIFVKYRLIGILLTQAVVFLMAGSAVATGWLWTRVFANVRLAVLFGMASWMPFLTTFLWLPALTPTSGKWLRWALNLHAFGGVFAALEMRNLFWNPLFYGRLPYAEYGVSYWKLPSHFGMLFAGMMVLFVAVFALPFRRR